MLFKGHIGFVIGVLFLGFGRGQQNISSDTDKELMKLHVVYLADFLEKIYKLNNKGTHYDGNVNQEYANRCVIYTYLILGDIINLTK